MRKNNNWYCLNSSFLLLASYLYGRYASNKIAKEYDLPPYSDYSETAEEDVRLEDSSGGRLEGCD